MKAMALTLAVAVAVLQALGRPAEADGDAIAVASQPRACQESRDTVSAPSRLAMCHLLSAETASGRS